MKIVGCDFHPKWQQIAVFDKETGEITEHKLMNGNGEAERFYRGLGVPTLIGVEACGNSQWSVDLLGKLRYEVWIGDAARIRASYVRKQKTDRRDAGHILQLLLEDRFPRLWVPSAEQRDLRQLLMHRHKLLEMRTRVKNGLQHVAMNRGFQKHSRLWDVRGRAFLKELSLEWWAARRRDDLLGLLGELDRQVRELDEAVEQAAGAHPQVSLLRTQPGVGPITALAFVVTIGDVRRFAHSGQVASGLIPANTVRAASSGWARSASRVTVLCASCWSKRCKRRAATMMDFASSIRHVAITSHGVWPRWRRPGSWQCDSTGCSGRMWAIQRSPMSRVARLCPWPATRGR